MDFLFHLLWLGKQNYPIFYLSQNLITSFLCSRRRDLTDSLKNLKCKTLIFVGESSPFHSEALHMSSEMDGKKTAFVEVGDDFRIYACTYHAF